MAKHLELIRLLRERLEKYRYIEFDEAYIEGGEFAAVIKTPRRWMVSYICAIVDIPDIISDLRTMKQFFNVIRRSLTAKYAKFPWYKELGTFLVLLCKHKLYEKLQGSVGSFKDWTGYHMNVMLGTCLVDKDNFENTATSTWGLYYSGKHYKAISTTVDQWCESQRKKSDLNE